MTDRDQERFAAEDREPPAPSGDERGRGAGMPAEGDPRRPVRDAGPDEGRQGYAQQGYAQQGQDPRGAQGQGASGYGRPAHDQPGHGPQGHAPVPEPRGYGANGPQGYGPQGHEQPAQGRPGYSASAHEQPGQGQGAADPAPGGHLRDGLPQGGSPQGHAVQGGPPQGYAAQGGPPQDYAAQGGPSQGYAPGVPPPMTPPPGQPQQGPPAHDRPGAAAPAHDGQGDNGGRLPSSADGPSMLEPGMAEQYRSRWDDVQTAFVDRPYEAVAQADALVGDVLGELERTFREQRAALDPVADVDDSSTEELRRALRRYREFFDRLLAM